MSPRCLICDSKAIVSADAAKAAVMVIGTIDSFLFGVRQARTRSLRINPDAEHESPLVHLFALVTKGVSTATSCYPAVAAFAGDMLRYQFSSYDRLCLRCGAKFDQSRPKSPQADRDSH